MDTMDRERDSPLRLLCLTSGSNGFTSPKRPSGAGWGGGGKPPKKAGAGQQSARRPKTGAGQQAARRTLWAPLSHEKHSPAFPERPQQQG